MRLNRSYDDGVLRIRLTGELDHHISEEMRRAVEQEIDRYLPRRVILDLSALSFMDSSGIALILHTSKRASEINARFQLFNPAAQPDKVLRAAGIERIVSIMIKDQEAEQ